MGNDEFSHAFEIRKKKECRNTKQSLLKALRIQQAQN